VIEYSSDDELLIGKVADIDSLILFSGVSLEELQEEFVRAVDEYVAHCEAMGVAPEKPCKGTFNVRVGADVHRQAVTVAKTRHVSLNEFVKDALCQAIERHMHQEASEKIFASADFLIASAPSKLKSAWRESRESVVTVSEISGESTYRH